MSISDITWRNGGSLAGSCSCNGHFFLSDKSKLVPNLMFSREWPAKFAWYFSWTSMVEFDLELSHFQTFLFLASSQFVSECCAIWFLISILWDELVDLCSVLVEKRERSSWRTLVSPFMTVIGLEKQNFCSSDENAFVESLINIEGWSASKTLVVCDG